MEPIRRVPAACFYIFPLPKRLLIYCLHVVSEMSTIFFGLSYQFSSEQCAKENHAQTKETLNPTTQADHTLPQNRQNMEFFSPDQYLLGVRRAPCPAGDLAAGPDPLPEDTEGGADSDVSQDPGQGAIHDAVFCR